ncbi:galactose-3-O-sulfotransferase 2 isoform X2 [Struthio camelus]|uniref:galactose-3-O-sulfotransferase 2 isoform X2 n=1 Tax=Struthio camelus TaxID=8801 RepID=UPI003603E028
MLKFKRKLKAIYRCQLGRLWISFSLLILLLVTLQVVEKLQPAKNCRCELERALQQTTGKNQKRPSYILQIPKTLGKDVPPHRQKKAMPDPISTKSAQYTFQLQPNFSQTTLRESSPDSQEGFWTKQLVESNKKVKTYLSSKRLKSHLLGPRRAAKEGPSPIILGSISTVMRKAADNIRKTLTFANSITAEEHKRTASPRTTQVSLQSQSQATVSPPHRWDSPPNHAMIKTAQDLQAEEFYRAGLKRRLLPSWTEVPMVEKAALGEGQQVEGISSQEAVCKPKTNIVFLKVHKSASSTVMNILFRFGETHNLTFAFPLKGSSQLFYPHHFLARFVQGFSPGNAPQFNILCHHMRFLQPEVQRVVPSTAIYFSILRNPVQLMESSFMYYKGTSAFSRARSLEEFLSQPYHFYNPAASDSHYARNLMTFDFGFNPDGDVSAKRVHLMLKAIEASFDLLLISEYFDESMVLLKEILCWDLDSVVSFPLNSRDSSTRSPLSDSMVEKIKNWNRLDWEIYTHFNKTFWERIDRDIGRERMQREVRALQERQAELARICLQGRGSVAPKDIKDSSLLPLQYGNAKILGYNLKQGLDKKTEHMCRRLVTPELQYSSALYKKQFLQTQKPVSSLQGTQQGNTFRGPAA